MKHSFLLIILVVLIGTTSYSQNSKTEYAKNWHIQNKDSSGVYGISLDKAYSFINSKKIKSKQVLVAVIDSGIDTLHEDLQAILWTNPKEIPYNGIDDDKNGFIDDIHGWNFLGGKDGRNVKKDSYEAARVYNKIKLKYNNYGKTYI